MKMLICCGGGFSSSALARQMNKQLEELNLGNDLEISFSGFGGSHKVIDEYDVALLCPHLRHSIDKYIKDHDKPLTTPLYVIPPQMYGLMPLAELYQDALDVIEIYKATGKNPVCFPGEESIIMNKRKKAYYHIYPRNE